MKRLVVLLCLLLTLCACESSDAADGSRSDPVPEHSHLPFVGDNVAEHAPEGYCGNTVTTVRCVQVAGQEENWERSFWGETSVALTDFLRWLEMDDGTCRCLPEYYVKTEFAAGEYGINLTHGYVRFEGRQTQLTQEQLDFLQELLARVAQGDVEGLCALPPEKQAVYEMYTACFGQGSGVCV